MDVVGNYIIAIDACVRQLSDKNEQVDFNDNSLELLGSSVFKWILNVTLTKTYGLFSNERKSQLDNAILINIFGIFQRQGHLKINDQS